MGLVQLLQRGVKDVEHPFGIGSTPAPAPQPVRTPAPVAQPMQAPRPVIRTPAPIAQAPKPTGGFVNGLKNFGGNVVHDTANVGRDSLGAAQATARFVAATPKKNVVAPFVENNIVKPVTNTFAAPVEAGRSLVAQATHNQAASTAADKRQITDIQGSLPRQIVLGVGQFGNALRYVPGTIANEIKDKPGPNISAQQGLNALNKSYQGPALTGVEDVLAHKIPGASDEVKAAGVDPNVSIASVVAKTAAGTLNDFAPLAGAEYGDPLGLYHGTAKLVDKAPAIAQTARDAATVAKAKAVSANSKVLSTPTARANLADQSVMRRYSDYLAGATNPKGDQLNKLISDARAVGAKHGINLTNGTVAEKSDGIGAVLDNIGKQRTQLQQGGYVRNPLAGKGPEGENPLEGNQPKKLPAQQPSTGAYANKAKLPNTKALTNRSTGESPMVPLKDAIAAKQAKLKAGDTSEAPVKATAKAPLPGAKTKASRFANVTVQNSEDVPDNVKQLVQEKNVQYTPAAMKAGQDAAASFVKKTGINKATTAVVTKLHGTEDGKITRQDVFNAQNVAARLAKTGKADDAATSADIYGKLSAHHTAAGQQIQAAAALAKISPEGLHQSAIKAITNGGKNGAKQKISVDLAGKISAKVDEISKAKEGSEERNDHVQELQRIVNQNVHHSVGSKIFSLWRTGLLTGPQTMTKVGVSHALMATAEKVKDIPAVAIDKSISGVSRILGKGPMRSTALTLKGEGSGFKTGTRAAIKLLKTGNDTKGTGGMGDTLVGQLAHPEVDFGTSKLGKAANFYVQKTGGIHASIPKGFFTAAQANDLFKQAMAEGINKGLKGDDLQKHIDNYTQGASDFAKQEAQLSAQRASFQQETALGRVGRQLQGVKGGKYLLPFAKIASTILSDAVDYSPAGALKAGWEAFRDSKGAEGWTPAIQKHFVEELGRSITGTGAIAAGAQLFNHGVMTLGYPTNKSEQAIWKAEGRTENSILINGKWRDTSSLGPFGTLLFMGGSIAQSHQSDAKGRSQAGAAVTGAIQNVTSQSYLSGLTGAANALSQPTEFAGSEEKQLAGSVVPIAVATAARATDSRQRNAPGVVQSVESKIPGVRETLSPQQDMFGRTLNRESGVGPNLLDPTRPSGNDAGPQVNELQRLQNTTGTTAVPQPVKAISGTDAAGKTVNTALTQKQQDDYNAAVGPQIKSAYTQIMNDPNYKQLTDTNKVSALNSAKDNIETVQKAQVLNGINGNTVKLTSAQKAGAVPDYVQNKLNEQSGGTAGDPINPKLDASSVKELNSYNGMTAAARKTATYDQNDFAYNYAQAKYNNDTLNGTLTKAGAVKAQVALAKDKVGSAYSQDTRDIYGLTKDEIYGLITTDPNGKAIASQLQSYDQALYNAGIISSRKFANGFGSGSGSGSSSASLPTAINYKSSVPKTGLGKFNVGGSKAPGSSKAKLVGYSSNNANKVSKLPGAPKSGSSVTLARTPALFKPSAGKITKRKGIAI